MDLTKMTRMRLTTIYLSAIEREALERLKRATGETRSECMRAAIRDAAKRLNATTKTRKRAA